MAGRDDAIRIIGVASPYAWDVVETCLRLGRVAVCVDNFGGADAKLPGLIDFDALSERDVDWTLGLSSAVHRGIAATDLHNSGFGAAQALVDPTAAVASTATIKHGAFVNAGAVVASHTEIGCHANVNRSASIGHDCAVRFAASIGPGAVLTGHVTVGESAFVGAGATVLPGRTIGIGAIVGAGAVVTADVPDYAIVVGNPARATSRAHETEVRTKCPHC